MTIRPHDALNSTPRRLGAVALLAACALLGSLLLAAAASAAPQQRSGAAGSWVDTATHSGAIVSGTGTHAAGTNPTATASVIGGHSTTIEKYPSLAFIEGLQATDGYACSGSVVAPRVILTAGHCVEDLSSGSLVEPGLVGVATGISNLQNIPRDKISTVERVLVNPHFNPSELHGDAGLLILSQPVTATPIPLATSAETSLYEPGTKLTVAGWGIDHRGSETIPNQLQAATIPVEESKRCAKGIRRIYPFLDPSSQVCTIDAGHFHITPCHGDSGGPLMGTRADGSLVEAGVVSLGDATCKPTSPAVYTRAYTIQPWVQKWIDHVEAGGPEPKVRVPKARLPVLTRERAEEISYLLMLEAFKSRFQHGHEKAIHCSRQGKAKLKCDVTWWLGANDYFGRINVFYAIRHNVVLVASHYSINSVNDRCYFHSGDPQSCKVETISH